MLPEMLTDALISDCSLFRYHLLRTWDESRPTLNIIGLNPSTADATRNDPTIRRCIGFAIDNGFGKLYVTNLFAFRATKPNDLFNASDSVGPENDHWLKLISAQSQSVLFAWGNHGQRDNRDKNVLKFLPEGFCLGISKTGAPRHPLYIRKEQPFLPYPDSF